MIPLFTSGVGFLCSVHWLLRGRGCILFQSVFWLFIEVVINGDHLFLRMCGGNGRHHF